ncbi:beta-ketoacyl synthase N-terminal-like domain-containing protein [Actinocorallia sp. A-T 12471]|uniref:beta-ketoacyl synthase N-terminal-like domain-containing protein n=1 Tax=Actinocorallia sp. A-T 12471 TaxID=3089813 RepID=UPI0029CF50FA|nr:beta-ketoacyl synthase N-terminal-like domain-containing protein [Actinocorallia sp. A-T 12471]MDX6744131.1 beta-ketoacyl synthase N-terminal-like domain-containing protein [Actinocorallia sp. A-T 12471]
MNLTTQTGAAAQAAPAGPILPKNRVPDELTAALTVLAEAHWPPPGDPDPTLPEVPRWDVSFFAPLLMAAAEPCLTGHFGAPPLAAGDRVGLVMAATRGDTVTQTAIDEAANAPRPVPKHLLFQNVPSTAPGHLAALWGLAGPFVTLLATGCPLAAARERAARLIATGDADHVLAVALDPGDHPSRPGTAQAQLLAASGR